MGDLTETKEQHTIQMIENLVCKLAGDVSSTLAGAEVINNFFFGAPRDETGSTPTPKKPAPAGWFEQHVDIIRGIHCEVMDINTALENIHRVINKE